MTFSLTEFQTKGDERIIVYNMQQYRYFKNVMCASVECVRKYISLQGKKIHVVIECVGQCPSPFAFDFCKLTTQVTILYYQKKKKVTMLLLLGQ